MQAGKDREAQKEIFCPQICLLNQQYQEVLTDGIRIAKDDHHGVACHANHHCEIERDSGNIVHHHLEGILQQVQKLHEQIVTMEAKDIVPLTLGMHLMRKRAQRFREEREEVESALIAYFTQSIMAKVQLYQSALVTQDVVECADDAIVHWLCSAVFARVALNNRAEESVTDDNVVLIPLSMQQSSAECSAIPAVTSAAATPPKRVRTKVPFSTRLKLLCSGGDGERDEDGTLMIVVK
jgi:hypothetical protein